MTHDSRLLTSHCHSVTFAYPRERKGSIDAISISYCAYALPLGAQYKFSSHQLIFLL